MYYYTLGFVFDIEYEHVLLIRKNKPLWQKGRYNGIGGKLEQDEPILEGMIREFQEETGHLLPTFVKTISFSGTSSSGNWRVYCFRGVLPLERMREINIKTSDNLEPIICAEVDTIIHNDKLISNLKWVIPLHADQQFFDENQRMRTLDVTDA